MFFFMLVLLFELCASLEIIPYLEESCSIDQNPHWNIFNKFFAKGNEKLNWN